MHSEHPSRLVPQPRQIRMHAGGFHPGPELEIGAGSGTEATAGWLAALLRRATGWAVPVRSGSRSRAISIAIDPAIGVAGSYRLRADATGISLAGADAAGAFHACQTLRQLLPPMVEDAGGLAGGWALPGVDIEDAPRFAWRGALLDSARAYHRVDDVLGFIDLLAFYKFNRFHWHLTDDQGWRLPVPGWPRLAEDGGRRVGGAYTAEELRRVVAYAAERHIVIIPEIDMPGHTNAATYAYPELSCRGAVPSMPSTAGNYPNVLCPGNEAVYAFVADVLAEVARIFPGTWIHIGGDECVKDHWRDCPRCQAAIRAQGLRDEKALEHRFIARVAGIVRKLGRRLIGWDETLELAADGVGHEVAVTYPAIPAEDPLPIDAVVQSWRDGAGVVAAARLGHDVIASPNDRVYLSNSERMIPLERTYGFEPLPSGLSAAEAAHVVGLEACLWNPTSDARVRARSLLPRLGAVAERAWSPADVRDVEAFRRRLLTHRRHWRSWGMEHGSLAALAITCDRPEAVDDRRACRVRFHLRNRADEPVRVAGPEGIELLLAAQAGTEVELTLRTAAPWDPAFPEPVPALWRAQVGAGGMPPIIEERTILVAPDPLRPCPAADPGLPYAATRDGAARFGVHHADGFLHIAVQVQRPSLRTDARAMPWQQDGIEIRVDGRDDETRFASDGEFEFQDLAVVAVSPGGATEAHGALYRPGDLPPGTRVACRPAGDGYRADIALPLAWFRTWQPEGLRRFRLNLAVNRPDADGRVVAESWRPAWRLADSFPWSGTFTLA